MSWRDSLRPASFRGVSFKVEASSKAGGRRGQTYEYPKRDEPTDEDLGRRAKRFSVSGYVIGADHNILADVLETALNQEGPGQLVTPLMGSARVRCETYTRTDRRQEGGVTSFDMVFVEAGSPISSRIAESTQAAVDKAADTAEKQVARSANKDAGSDKALPAPTPMAEAI